MTRRGRRCYLPLVTLPWPALVVLALLAVAGIVSLWSALVRRRLHLPTEADEVHLVPTADGWRIALLRLRATGGPRRPTPVLLCHGLWANRFNVNFDRERSLGRYLAERGHDVWLVELRGSGLSARPGPDGPSRDHVGFDEHVRFDAPAAIARVLEVTGAERLLWVGHSMGGMIAYALAGGPEAAKLAGVVAVASPASFAHLDRGVKALVRLGRPLARRGLRIRWAAGLVAPWFGWVNPPGGYAALNPRNMEGSVIRRALYNLVGDLGAGHVAQFGEWIEHGDFRSGDGAVDYRARLADVRVPFYFVAGAQDRLAPPSAVETAYERLGSADKRFEVLGRACGCAEDYGHGDLLLGRRVREEVYPRIADWLEAHQGAGTEAGAAGGSGHGRPDEGAAQAPEGPRAPR